MSGSGRFILFGGMLAGTLLIGLVIYLIASQPAPAAPRPPELGGQKVPARVFEIPFDRRYDLFCSFYAGGPTTYRNCKIRGFTGSAEEDSAGSSGFASYSPSSRYTKYFDHWLVLELPDGRLAYIPPDAVKYIEEASPQGR